MLAQLNQHGAKHSASILVITETVTTLNVNNYSLKCNFKCWIKTGVLSTLLDFTQLSSCDFLKLSRGSLLGVWKCPQNLTEAKGKAPIKVNLYHWNGLWILSQIGLLILGAFPAQQELSLAKQYIATRLLKYKIMESWRLMRRTILSFLLCTCACMHTIFYWVSTLIYTGFLPASEFLLQGFQNTIYMNWFGTKSSGLA